MLVMPIKEAELLAVRRRRESTRCNRRGGGRWRAASAMEPPTRAGYHGAVGTSMRDAVVGCVQAVHAVLDEVERKAIFRRTSSSWTARRSPRCCGDCSPPTRPSSTTATSRRFVLHFSARWNCCSKCSCCCCRSASSPRCIKQTAGKTDLATRCYPEEAASTGVPRRPMHMS